MAAGSTAAAAAAAPLPRGDIGGVASGGGAAGTAIAISGTSAAELTGGIGADFVLESSALPQWIRQVDRRQWLSRIRIWSIYRCSPHRA